MIILSNDYQDRFCLINSYGAHAKIYADFERKNVYKIYRTPFRYNDYKFKAYESIKNPFCIKPLEPVALESVDNFIGVMTNYSSGISLPFLRGASIDELMGAALKIDEVVREISEAKFLVPDSNPQNVLFSQNFELVDMDEYIYLKKIIADILYKANIRIVNHTILRGLFGLSYRQMIIRYLNVFLGNTVNSV